MGTKFEKYFEEMSETTKVGLAFITAVFTLAWVTAAVYMFIQHEEQQADEAITLAKNCWPLPPSEIRLRKMEQNAADSLNIDASGKLKEYKRTE